MRVTEIYLWCFLVLKTLIYGSTSGCLETNSLRNTLGSTVPTQHWLLGTTPPLRSSSTVGTVSTICDASLQFLQLHPRRLGQDGTGHSQHLSPDGQEVRAQKRQATRHSAAWQGRGVPVLVQVRGLGSATTLTGAMRS